MRARTLPTLLAIVLAAGCGGGGDPLESADPRCSAICMPEEPAIEGAFDVCSGASVEGCVEQCEARIADLESLCATCLLEDADFSREDAEEDAVAGGSGHPRTVARRAREVIPQLGALGLRCRRGWTGRSPARAARTRR